MRLLANTLLILAIAACPVLCGTCWEILGLEHKAVLGEGGGDHSPLTPANDGDDCICKCKGAVAIGSSDLAASGLGKLNSIPAIDLFDGLGWLVAVDWMPVTLDAGLSGRENPPRARATLRSMLQNFRC